MTKLEEKTSELLLKIGYHANENDTPEIIEQKIRGVFAEIAQWAVEQTINHIKDNAEYVENSYEARDGDYFIVDTSELKEAANAINAGIIAE